VKKSPPPSPTPAPPLTPGLRRFLLVTAAVTGGAVMVIEILGAKLLAPYFGTSHFVWTAQIGVTLLALALGYALGGWLADRSPRPAWIYGGLVVAAAWLCGVVLWVEPIAYGCLRFELALGSLAGSGLLFFVPLALLAMVSPFFARVLTRSLEQVGRSVGRLIALGTLGSVAGTVLISYVVIPRVPNSVSLYACAALLGALALAYFAGWQRAGLAPAALAVGLALLVGGLGAARPPFADLPGWRELYRGNSNFGLLQVIESEDGARRYYLNDLLTQNSYAPAERQSVSLFTHMLHGLGRAYAPQVEDVLCIGMGVGIVPMQFAREGARVDVVEINPAVVPLAERFFDFEPARVRLVIGDGRYFVTRTTHRYDLIVLDAFLGDSSPSHLMTREAFAAMRRCLKPGGVLVMNTISDLGPGRDFLVASLARTLGAVFRSHRVHAAGNGNIFLVASDQPDLAPRRTPDFARMPAVVRYQAEEAFLGVRRVDPAHGRVLTDDFNPVEFYDAVNRVQLRRTLALAYRPR
jgi:spermidine synthase